MVSDINGDETQLQILQRHELKKILRELLTMDGNSSP